MDSPLPLFAIKTKPFLASKTIILVNEGCHYALEEKQVETLKESGFDVFILWGGLYFWHINGGPIVGDIFEAEGQNLVSPMTYFHERNYANWVIVDIRPEYGDEHSYFNREIYHIPYDQNFVERFKAFYEKHKTVYSLFMIFSEEGTEYEGVEKELREGGISEVFFLEQGMQGYRKVVEDQIRIYKKDGTNRRTITKCGGCS